MATITDRLAQNITGRYYVDDSCIDCGLCHSNAPAFFAREDRLGLSIVHQQPSTPDEIAQAEEALQGCPANSIGNDGELS